MDLSLNLRLLLEESPASVQTMTDLARNPSVPFSLKVSEWAVHSGFRERVKSQRDTIIVHKKSHADQG